MPGFMLYTWGSIPFEVYPLNVGEIQHVTETDWARKEIAGSAIHHEWVGENEEEIHFRGRVFPHFFAKMAQRMWGGSMRAPSPAGPRPPSRGGLGHLDVLDNMRRMAHVHVLARSDGWHLGWFGIKRFSREHSFLYRDGIGQMINFEVYFTRFPVPNDPAPYFGRFLGAVEGGT